MSTGRVLRRPIIDCQSHCHWRHTVRLYPPNPRRISRDPTLGESHQLSAVRSCFSNNVTCLFHGCFQVQPDWLCLGDCDAHFRWHGGLMESRCVGLRGSPGFGCRELPGFICHLLFQLGRLNPSRQDSLSYDKFLQVAMALISQRFLDGI